MGNQQVNGTPGGAMSMSSSSSRRGGGGYDGPQAPGAGGDGLPYGASGGVVGSSSANDGNNPNDDKTRRPGGGSAQPADHARGGGHHHGHPIDRYPGTRDGIGGVRRTASDMSMTDMTASAHSHHPGGGGGDRHPQPAAGGQHQHGVGVGPGITLDLATISAAEEDAVPTVFRWEHGGRNVYITGTFNGWSRQIPMHRSGNDFTYIHNLKRGKHAFKFIVDDEWRFAPDQPTVADIEGRINNFIDVTDFKAYTGDLEFENERHAVHCSRAAEAAAAAAARRNGAVVDDDGGRSSPPGSAARGIDRDGENSSAGGSGGGRTERVYGHAMPDLDEYTKEPPPLPPHLRHIILNKPPQLQDTAALPVPQHVALNHLYCTAIKDNMMVLGITQRYKMKSCTTVYYSPC
ncbi:hypothetical protein ACHAW5_005473 [Stephanodiscus triporus]|uniref:Association with the SNF1 complex (ASC) domain-containing protein n=1 Tax=Stephanodiscus triporus TaxID=2934178 RepID=A0ABD3NH29_9STRA